RTSSLQAPEVHTSPYLREPTASRSVGRAALFFLDHATTSPAVTPARRISAVPGPVARSLVDVPGAAAPVRPPRRPEHEVGEEGDEPYDDHDPPDGVDVDGPRIGRVYREREDEAHDGDDQSDHESHGRLVPWERKSNPNRQGAKGES